MKTSAKKRSAKKNPISDRELNQLMHDVMCDELLDELGAPKEDRGAKLSIYGRMRRVANAFQADKRRLEWLVAHSAFLSHSRDGEVCNVWFAHDPDDDSNGAVPIEGYPQKCYVDSRAAIDAAMNFKR